MALSAFRTSCSSRAPKSAPAASEVSGYETIWRADISDCSVWSDTLRSKLVVFTGEHIHLLERHSVDTYWPSVRKPNHRCFRWRLPRNLPSAPRTSSNPSSVRAA